MFSTQFKLSRWLLLAAAVSAAVIVAALGVGRYYGGTASALTCTPWAGEGSLQVAIDFNTCVEVQPGTYTLNQSLIIHDGRTVQGNPAYPRESIVLKAALPWAGNGNEAVIYGVQPPHTGIATVKHLTSDASGLATGAVGASDMHVEDVVIKGGRCWGVATVGPNMTVINSAIRENGADPSCPSAPGAGVYMSTNGTPYGDYRPVYRNNEISHNTGPGVDIFNVWNGTFENNNVHDNTSWAGVSLFGAFWSVKNNTITHPATFGGQPNQPFCNGGPNGSHSAALMLCQGTIANGIKTTNNTVSGNTLSSYYGILSIGNDEANALAVPHKNTFVSNIFTTNTVQCADDYRKSGPNINIWTNAGCRPVYF